MAPTRRSAILGPDGRPVEVALLTEEFAPTEAWGVRSTRIPGVASGLTPERMAEIMRQANEGHARAYLTLAMEMEERYMHYRSQLQVRRLAFDTIDPQVTTPEGVDAKIVDAVTELVNDPSFRAGCSDLQDGVAKGYSVVEPIWDYHRGALRPVRYAHRDPRFFQFDRVTLEELRLASLANLDGDPIPPGVFITHTPSILSGLPLRSGLARTVAWAFIVQSFTLQDWSAFAEIYGIPFRIGRYGPGASPEDRRTLLRAVRSIANDGAAIIPQSMNVEFEAVQGSHGEAVFGNLLSYLDRQVSKVVLGQTMTADEGSSLGQAKIHNEVRIDIQRADGQQTAGTINRDLIPWFVAMNFGPQDVYPQVHFPVAEPEDIKAITEGVAKLVPLGLRVSQRQMREKLALSEPEKDEELLALPGAAPPPTPPERLSALVEGAVRQVDEIDRRRALAAAEARMRGEDPDREGVFGWVNRKYDESVGWAKDKALDRLIAPLPTEDPSRALVERRAKEARDAQELADKGREEATKLKERAKGTKDKAARATLLEQARRARETASRQEATAAEGMRGAGPAGARDMTDVEYGDAAARASIEAKRQIALLERGLGAGSQPNVRIPGTGTIMSRAAAEAELLALRKRFEALGGPPAEPQAPAPAPAAPPAPVMTVPLPPARPGAAAPATPLPPARPASLTPPAAPVQPEPTVQPDATVQPAPTIQPQPTIQPAPGAPQPAPAGGAGGEAAALQQRIGVLERALAAGSQANVRIPDTGIITSRPSVEAEIAELRRRVESERPAPASSAPERPATTAPALAPSAPSPVPPAAQPVAAPPPVPGAQPSGAPAPTIAPTQPRPAAVPAQAPTAGGEAAGAVAALQQRIGVLERALAVGSQANVRIPDTGIITSRRSVEAEIAELRRRVESQRPAPAASVPERPATTAPAPAPAAPSPVPRTGAAPGGPSAPPGDITLKVDPKPALDGMRAAEEGAKRLQTTMGQDLSGPARESMQTYTAALKAGTTEAVAAVTAAVAQMKAMLSFSASPTITPRIVAPTGAAAPAGAAPAARASTGAAPAAPSSPAPRVQSAALRRGGGGGGGGGVTITGPVHVHGVQNVAGMHRQIARIADRRARDARDGALHDTGVESA